MEENKIKFSVIARVVRKCEEPHNSQFEDLFQSFLVHGQKVKNRESKPSKATDGNALSSAHFPIEWPEGDGDCLE